MEKETFRRTARARNGREPSRRAARAVGRRKPFAARDAAWLVRRAALGRSGWAGPGAFARQREKLRQPMGYQFMCPQGHLLQAEESQVGQICACPLCGVQLIIPAPLVPATPEPAVPPGAAEAAWSQTPAVPPSAAEGPNFREASPAFGADAAPGSAAPPAQQAEQAPVFAPTDMREPVALAHLVCPSGHVLETPREMLGQDAMCPYCQVAFRLRWEDSLEYRKAKEEEQLRRDQRIGRLWMQWSIAVAVVVVFGLGLLIALSRSTQ